MVSVGAAALTSAAFATGAAVVVMPAALVLFGRHIDALKLPRPALPAAGLGVARGRWQLGYPPRGLRRLRRDRPAGRDRRPGARDQHRTAERQAAARRTRRRGSPSRRSRGSWDPGGRRRTTSSSSPTRERSRPPRMLASLDRFQSQIARDPRVQLPVSGPGLINAPRSSSRSSGPRSSIPPRCPSRARRICSS